MDLNEPLAYRMKPKTLEDYVGQEHILGEDKILYRTIKADRLSSIILWGPPGCGKTSLAKVISNTTKYKFKKINAVTAGISDIKNAIEEAKSVKGKPTVIIMNSVKGKGVSFMENEAGWHGKAPNKEEYEKAIAELDAAITELEVAN